MENRTIAHYRIVDALGEGGMGAVYRAFDERLGRDVAIKLLKQEADPAAIERFFREARAASALNHPNIVTVFDAGESDEGHFIVMELVKGRVLRTLIGQPIALDRFASLARQAAEALGVAHDANIVHRDIKPENIMVRDDGYVKVLDFGLARISPRLLAGSGAETAIVSMTAPHTVVGTLGYMSPEQASNRPVGPASDVFALGIVLYELVTGRHPFEAASPYGVLHGIVSHAPVPPARLNPALAGSLDALLMRMLDKDATRRPSAAEVATVAGGSASDSTGAVISTVAAKHGVVGRAKPRAELREALDYVLRGHTLLVSVAGEAGIGKSTLVETFLSDLADAGDQLYVARGRCSERLAGTEAYLPLLDALDDLLRSDDGALARMMKATAPLWFMQIAPSALEDSSLGRLVNEARSSTQERLKRELVAFLAEACRSRPVIFFFDDLHWVDISTIDVLGYVTRQSESLPLLFVVTYRPEELLVRKHPFLTMKHELQGRGLCRNVALEFLARQEVQEYVSLRFANHRLPREFSDLIYAKTEGNPLFVFDLLDYLVDRHVLVCTDDVWALTRPTAEIAGEVPESVRGMIQRKIDLLEEGDRRLLVAASVQGHEFDSAIVSTVSGVDAADAEERLDVLDRVHGFVRRVREHEFPDGTLTLRYRFVHVLYQNMLYGALTPARRASFSRAVGHALVASFRDKTTDIASQLAVLFEAAREFSLAADYFRVASKKAADVFAYEEAFVLGQRALDMLRRVDDTVDRRRRELAVLITMGVPASASRGFSSPAAQTVYNRAIELCVELNETDQVARVLYGLITSNIVRLEVDRAAEAADRLLRLSRESGDEAIASHGINGQGLVAYYRGEFAHAIEYFRQLRAGRDLDERKALCGSFGYDPVSAAQIYIAWACWCLGYPDRALREIETGVQAANEVAFRYGHAIALIFESAVHCWRGDWERLRISNERCLALANEEGFAYPRATHQFLEGLRLARQEHNQEGLSRMRGAFATLRGMEGRTSLRRFATEYALELAAAGSIEEALDVVTTEIALAGRDRFWNAELARAKGEVLLRRAKPGDATEAERLFGQALAVAREQRAKSFELRAALSLARVWHAHGKSHEAATLLSNTYAWFTEGFETADLQDARRLLATLPRVGTPDLA